MPDNDDWAILRGNDPLCYGHVVGVRDSGILHDGNVVAFLLQCVVDAFPSRAVHETAVDQHYVLDVAWGACLRCRSQPPTEYKRNDGQQPQRDTWNVQFVGHLFCSFSILSSCKRISGATRLLPVWLHDATTDRMPESGIMVQPDFLAINYEELCDTNPSKPTCAPWHARWTPSANGGLCLSSVTPSPAYGASPIFRRAWGWQRTS